MALDLRVARAGTGSGVRGHPRHPDPAGRIRVTYGALSYAMLATGQVPQVPRVWRWRRAWSCSASTCLPRERRYAQDRWRAPLSSISCFPRPSWRSLMPSPGLKTPIAVNIALALLIVAAIGLFLYRIAFQPLAHTSVLVLLIASVGCHLALQGSGLEAFFGAEGLRGPAAVERGADDRPVALHWPESCRSGGLTIAFIVGARGCSSASR